MPTQSRIGIALDGHASSALTHRLVEAGYEVQAVRDLVALQHMAEENAMHAWVFDAREDTSYQLLLGTGRFLLPADNTPLEGDTIATQRWTAGLLAQLDAALGEGHPSVGQHNWSDVEAVWLLAGSAGAPQAVQAFLDTFSRPPPVAFLWAQHYEPELQHQLSQLTTSNSLFSLVLGEGRQQLGAGRVVVVPPRCQVSITRFGHVISTRTPWTGDHTPNISELMILMAAAGFPATGAIIFSGMGKDGADALPVLDASASRLWAQDPASAICDAMPRAALETGLVHRTGTPELLAEFLQTLYT